MSATFDFNMQAKVARNSAQGPVRVMLLVAALYYAGARIGLAFTFAPLPISVLWPPNALLFGALVLTPVRWWWAALAGALPAHLLAELPAGVPVPMVLCWFVSNSVEALIGASLMRKFSAQPGLRDVRSTLVFCFAATAGPFLSSFLDVAFVRALAWSTDEFATLWQARFFSNVLATLTFVPVFITWSASAAEPLTFERPHRILEASTLTAGLLITGFFAFDSSVARMTAPAMSLYLPIPFLIWAALRFGPALTTACYALVAFLVIWGASHGLGPFLHAAILNDAMPIQLFLITLAAPLLLLGAVIEERRKAEQRLRASEELFSSAFRRGRDAMAIIRVRDGSVLEANDRWRELLGYPTATLPAGIAPLADHLDDAGRRRIRFVLDNPALELMAELSLRNLLGGTRIATVAIAPVELAGEPCSIMIARDVTQQRQAEHEAHEQRRQLTHLTRVASLSDFSSTIAHELNQPLTAILANAQAALRFLARDPLNVNELRTILGEIVEADKRAGLLIHHLRLLMKKGEEEFVSLDLNHLVIEVLEFVRSEFLLRSVEVRTSYAPDLPGILGDRVQLQQVVLNLVCNACEAMQAQPGPKVLTVTNSHAADGKVQILVSDTGPGVPPTQLERIFEPLYTTKENGLGMGLCICRRIAAAHGGVLSMQSAQGKGANFRLVLPPAGPRHPGRASAAAAHLVAGRTPRATAS